MHNITYLKAGILTSVGFVGSGVAIQFGGWDTGLKALIIFMAIDYLSGIVVAGVFNKSGKTKNGSLSSSAGFKGLCKKGMILFLVLISSQLDITLGLDFIKDTVIIAFIANETISILENAGLMGIPIPGVLIRAIEILKSKEDKTDGK